MEPQDTQSGINQNLNQPQEIIQTVNQENSVKPKRLNKLPIIVLVLIIIVGLGIMVFAIVKPKIDKDKKSKDQAQPSTTNIKPLHYIGSQTISFIDVSGGTNTGSVTRNITKGLVTHTLQAQLSDPEEGYIYQSWLISDNEDPVRYAILYKNEQGLYTFNTEFKFDSSEPPFTTFDTMHNIFIVSKESINDDLIEEKILEGTFTQ